MTREEWLEERRKYIGASDMPAVLGVDPFRCALDVYLDKRGMAPEVERTRAMEAGTVLEPTVLTWYGQRFEKNVTAGGSGIVVCNQHPWAACTPDGYEVPAWIPVQVKCTGKTGDWEREVPHHVYVQVQHELLCTGATEGVAVALVSEWSGFDLRAYRIARDEEMLARIVAAGEDMTRRIREGSPPDPDGSKAASRAVRTLVGGTDRDIEPITLGIDSAEDTDRIIELAVEIKSLTKERESLRQRIQVRMGSAPCAVLPGGGAWSISESGKMTYRKGRKQ